MDVTPQELRDSDIKPAFRGYDPTVVDELLDRAAATIETQNEKIRILTDRLGSTQNESGGYRETEDLLHKTLLLAQRTADEAIAEAQEKARGMVTEAEGTARGMIAEAELEVRRIAEVERRRVEDEVHELARRRDTLANDVSALEQWEREYRERVVRQIEADLERARGRGATAPGPRPALSDVELPEAVARRADAPTQAIVIDTDANRGESAPLVGSAKTADTVGAVAASSAGPAPAAARTAPAAPAPRAAAPDIDLAAESEPARHADTDLDDDQFFATLREAVRDDAPLDSLSNRDDETFDDDREPTFREMFRRRR